ncbi:hypothetical protein C9374_010346 [Naegleria lovaniensis]|uniref:BTB domain-containing protein n=1 Tax=Naegleria lovaniensis TaxID=51637 RepID=A0AA88GCB1_NAELO|nr:uncharacterized protein C9374_010346 [Naegleria lovaniensis]KAG2374972.1 hypothetical protein C9374_010346 [Naegleria lovaniensis]
MSEVISVKCFDSSFSDSFNNISSFPDIVFTLEGSQNKSSSSSPHIIYAHRVILYKHRFFKNLFDVHESISQQHHHSPSNRFDHEKSNRNVLSDPLQVPIQEPFKIFSTLIEYFYSGIVKCELNDLSELIMMAYRFKIINLISLLKKQLMGDVTHSILDSSSTFDKNLILQLPEGTKMTLENALSLFNEITGSYSSLEHSIFKSEMHLAKRVILKSVCFGLLFQNQQLERLLKFSVQSLQSLLELLIQHLQVVKEIQNMLLTMQMTNSIFTTRELIKFVLKWLCHMKQERLFSISQLYPALRTFEEEMGAEYSPKIGGGTEVQEFIKSIEMMQLSANKKGTFNTLHSSGNSSLTSDHDSSSNETNHGSTEGSDLQQQLLLRKRGVSTLSKIGSFSFHQAQHQHHQPPHEPPADRATATPPSKEELTRDTFGDSGRDKTLKRTTTFTSPRQLQLN